ncbi:MAG: hypothetical protein AAF928_20835 [Myxococcota bacterium]
MTRWIPVMAAALLACSSATEGEPKQASSSAADTKVATSTDAAPAADATKQCSMVVAVTGMS